VCALSSLQTTDMGAACGDTDSLIVTITPSKASAYGQCPLYFAEVYEKQTPSFTNRSIQRGRYLHAVIERYNKARIDGDTLGRDDIIARVPVPPTLLTDGDQWDAVGYALEHLYGYEAWLDKQDFAALLAKEQYIRTIPRPVTNVNGAFVIFSGRIDLVALTREGTIAFVDVKASHVLAPEALQTSLASFVQRHLGVYAYNVEDVQICQVVPATGQMSRARLAVHDIEAGTALCRSMVSSIKNRRFVEQPGEHCAYCSYASRCTAFAGRIETLENAF